MRKRQRSRRAVDPRALVAAGFLLALALVTSSAMLLVRSEDQARRAVRHVQVSVEEPLGYLGDALEADTAGEALLQRAVVATGDERSALLSQSIAMAETATKAWTSYRASALHLPGEAELAATYERDYAAGKAIAGSVLVPIIQSNMPMPLPAEQILAAELDRQDLIALQAIYEREDHAALRSLDQQQAREREAVLIAAAALGVMLLMGFGFALRVARHAVADRRKRATLADLTEFENTLTNTDNTMLSSFDITVTDTLVTVTGTASAEDSIGSQAEGFDPTVLEDSISANLKVTMPGRIISHNADSQSGNTLTWKIPVLGGTLDVQASSDPTGTPASGGGGGFPIWLIAVIAVVVLGGGYYLWTQNKKPGGGVAPADTPPPAPTA